MSTPHRIATTCHGELLVIAIGRHLAVFSCRFQRLISFTTDKDALWPHTGLIRQIYLHERFGEEAVVISTGDDKLVKVWSLPGLELKSSRPLLKRANAISVTRDGKNILVGDKFGDVYMMSLASEEVELSTASMEGKRNLKDPILGHVSMLTSISAGELDGKQFIVTSDRDEHVKVTEYPKTHVIRGWGFGHTKFVSAVLPLAPTTTNPAIIISGGGDDFLLAFNPLTLAVEHQIDISILRGYMKVKSLVPAAWAEARKRKRKNGEEIDGEQKEDLRDDAIPDMAVVKIMAVASDVPEMAGVILFSAGSSALLFIPRPLLHATSSSYEMSLIDLTYPILDISISENGRCVQVLRDTDFAVQDDKDVSPLSLVEVAESKLRISPLNDTQCAHFKSHSDSLLQKFSSTEIIPSRTDLYWELTVYSKRALDDSRKDDMPEEESEEKGNENQKGKRKGHGKKRWAKQHLKRKFDEVGQ